MPYNRESHLTKHEKPLFFTSRIQRVLGIYLRQNTTWLKSNTGFIPLLNISWDFRSLSLRTHLIKIINKRKLFNFNFRAQWYLQAQVLHLTNLIFDSFLDLIICLFIRDLISYSGPSPNAISDIVPRPALPHL